MEIVGAEHPIGQARSASRLAPRFDTHEYDHFVLPLPSMHAQGILLDLTKHLYLSSDHYVNTEYVHTLDCSGFLFLVIDVLHWFRY